MPGFAGLAVLLTAGALLASASPSLLNKLAQQTPRSEALASVIATVSPAPDPRLAPLALLHKGLFSQLREADQRWIPTSEPLPDGGTRYEYRRRPGDPELSLAEIKALIANPPSHTSEQEAIRILLSDLQRAGVQIALTNPLKPGAAAEWDPTARTIRIEPESVGKGTVDFLRLLTHESIHVAQSCSTGQLWSTPKPLGLPTRMPPELERTVGDVIASSSSSWEVQLEREAYANQHRVDLGSELIRRYCPARQPTRPGSLAGMMSRLAPGGSAP
ncbi:MAG: hypothetical protein ACK550_14665 [Synechococcaceae cyanobacterium]|jgi:hypothetical protein